MRYLIKLSYDGSAFHGWQIQSNAHTVQAEMEQKLSLFFGEKVSVTGCGRTDTGVHARNFYAHFDLKKELPFSSKDLIYKLNRFFDDSIAIYQLQRVPDDFHARFSAISRTYRYYLHQIKNPFLTRYSYYFPGNLDLVNMNKAAEILMKYRDFTSFSKLHTQTATNICHVTEAFWKEHENGKLIFTITADRFLRNMVRAVVGTLMEIGKGKIKPEAIQTIIEAKERQKAGYSVPAHGLFLEEILYDPAVMNPYKVNG